MQVESHLSRALSVPVVRRHARGGADSSDCFHYGPAVRIVSGNYVTGKRRGVVDGIDFGATGSGDFTSITVMHGKHRPCLTPSSQVEPNHPHRCVEVLTDDE